MDTMTFADYGANIMFGFVFAVVSLAVLWAKGKPFLGWYGFCLIIAVSPFSVVLSFPLAVMYTIKTLKEVK